jgi:hypothetical protein
VEPGFFSLRLASSLLSQAAKPTPSARITRDVLIVLTMKKPPFNSIPDDYSRNSCATSYENRGFSI